jgi:bifunctional DNA-binding transcriptional regulator/antitoxin component of YhaV-PrlF toxin-antitoxin module
MGSIMEPEHTARLSTRFHLSVPKAVRAALGWQVGQEFAFIPRAAGVLLVPVPKREELAGMARGANRTGYCDRIDRV